MEEKKKTDLVERPKVVDTKLIKKLKKIKRKSNIIAPVINTTGGCTPSGQGISASVLFAKAKVLMEEAQLFDDRPISEIINIDELKFYDEFAKSENNRMVVDVESWQKLIKLITELENMFKESDVIEVNSCRDLLNQIIYTLEHIKQIRQQLYQVLDPIKLILNKRQHITKTDVDKLKGRIYFYEYEPKTRQLNKAKATRSRLKNLTQEEREERERENLLKKKHNQNNQKEQKQKSNKITSEDNDKRLANLIDLSKLDDEDENKENWINLVELFTELEDDVINDKIDSYEDGEGKFLTIRDVCRLNNDILTNADRIINKYVITDVKINSAKNKIQKEVQNKHINYKQNSIQVVNDLKDLFKKTFDKTIEYQNNFKNNNIINKNTSYSDDDVKLFKEKIQKEKHIMDDETLDKFSNYLALYSRKLDSITSDEDLVRYINTIGSMLSRIDYKAVINMINKSKTGMGKGEYFLSCIFSDAEIAGSRKSFDLISNNKKYEVKCYPHENSRIRLGTEGRFLRFEAYQNLYEVLKTISDFLSIFDINSNKNAETNIEIFSQMIISAYNDLKNDEFFKNISLTDSQDVNKDTASEIISYIKSKFTVDSNEEDINEDIIDDIDVYQHKSIYEKFKSGEFADIDKKRTQQIIPIFKHISDKIIKNDYEYAKLVKRGDVYLVKTDLDGDPIINEDKDNINIECSKVNANILRQCDTDVKNAILKLRDNIGSVDIDIEKMYIDALNELNNTFREHPIIMIADPKPANIRTDYNKNRICFGVFSKIKKITSIAQAGVQIVLVTPEEDKKDEDKSDQD